MFEGAVVTALILIVVIELRWLIGLHRNRR